MLLLEDKYVKLLGSALALILVLGTITMAIGAASMPTVEVAQEAGHAGEATAALPEKETLMAALPRDQNRGDVVSNLTPVAPVEDKTRGENIRHAEAVWNSASGTESRPHTVSISQGDIWLLAQVIHAESRGESLQGQVAIGAVLLNRVRDSRFPNSLASVVYEPGAFCTVTDGQIYLTPDATALEAARLAASGWDPTGGALYFYNPARTTSRWIYSRPVINHIGRHVFAI